MKRIYLQTMLSGAGLVALFWLAYTLITPHFNDYQTQKFIRQDAQSLVDYFSRIEDSDGWLEQAAALAAEQDREIEIITPTSLIWAEAYTSLQQNGGVYIDLLRWEFFQMINDQHILRAAFPNQVFDAPQVSDYFGLIWLISLLAAGAIVYRVLLNAYQKSGKANEVLADFLKKELHNTPITQQFQSYTMSDDQSAQRLIHAVRDMNKKASDQRDLLHAVAHEFRSPIAQLRFAQDLAVDEQDAQRRQKLFADMDKAISELDDLVSEVLGYARLEHGGYKPNFQSSTLKQESVLAIDQISKVYPDVSFSINGADQDIAINVDRRLMQRALRNLIRNAARFASSSVHISCASKGQLFEVKVEDDGPGIPPGKRDYIFEPFSRLDPSRSRDSGGSGLGLPIARAASDIHHGTITVGDSQELGGALFTLKWPTHPNPKYR